MKKVLLVTDGFFHPPLLARKTLIKTLAVLDGYSFEFVRSMEKLPFNLETFSALVLYFHHKNISENALSKLDKFVSNGGGILGVHSVTASFKGEKRYFQIIGGRFTGHGPVESFKIESAKREIFGDIDDFYVRDELYLHDTQMGIDIHFTTKHEGKDVPAVWTYQYGEGRVCYAVPGHLTESMRNKEYQKVLQRGLSWVCGE